MSNTVAPVLQDKGTNGGLIATIPWRKFYLWVHNAAPTYALVLRPHR